MSQDFSKLHSQLGYQFVDLDFLVRALKHRSFANEQGDSDLVDNERLEFVGDAVLGLVVGEELFARFPDAKEGDLSAMRASLVCESSLADIARQLDLGPWLFLGKGEERSGGRNKSSLLANGFEAVVAAVYFDGGLAAAREVILRLFHDKIASASHQDTQDYKTRLQEIVQGTLRCTPVYEVVGEAGPEHAKEFQAAVKIQGDVRGQGRGRSKKEAEQNAAKQALQSMHKE